MRRSQDTILSLLSVVILIAASLLVAGCATGGRGAMRGKGSTKSQLKKIERQCAALRKIKLAQPPVQTPVDAWMERVRRAFRKGDRALATTQARRLGHACKTEARHRRDLAVLAEDIAQARRWIPPQSAERFHALCRAADYSNAIICGEAVLNRKPEKCVTPPLAPVRQPVAAAPTSGPTQGEAGTTDAPDGEGGDDDGEDDEDDEDGEDGEDLSEGGASEAPAVDPSAPRAWRMLVSLGIGVGSADLSGVHQNAEDLRTSFNVQNPLRSLGEAPTSGVQVNSELALRCYFPYHLLAQVGLSSIYNSASNTFGTGGSTLSNDNVALEIPLLVGAYYTVAKTFDLYAALGPSFLVLSGSYWTSDPGHAPDFEADAAVGAHFVLGADMVLGESWALGLDLRYRLLGGGELKERETGELLVSGDLLNDGSKGTYDFDVSGFSAALYLRFFVL